MTDAHRQSTVATQLDPDNPWPGLDSFEELAQHYFNGRDTEKEELLRQVADTPLTVVFGKSGLGKTSLLKAGLFPRLRETHFLPVYVRLDIRAEAPSPIEQIRDTLRAQIELEHVDAAPFVEGETLWEYIHRSDLEFWSRKNYPLTPVLVLDQFEEIFTLGARVPAEIERFTIDFGDLAENRIPASLATRLQADASAAQRFDLRTMRYKLLVALREDFLPNLEGWQRAVPSLGRVRLRLLPMQPEQALAAVYDTAPHLMDKALAWRIVAFVAAAQTPSIDAIPRGSSDTGASGGEIEPALLSLFCRGLNERRKQQGNPRFDERLLEGAQQAIIADYYRSCVQGLPDSVSQFIESKLITEKGFRNSFAKDDAVPEYITRDQLDHLVNRRLLRLEERYGTARIELTHDLLTRAVLEQRAKRRAEEEKATLARRAEEDRQELQAQARRQQQRFRVSAVIAAICLVLAGFAVWQWRDAVEAKQAALAAELQANTQRSIATGAQERAEAARSVAEEAKREAESARREAEKQAQLAKTEADEALVARGKAEANRARAEEERNRSISRQLAAQVDLLDRESGSAELMTLLAVEAARRSQNPDSMQALAKSLGLLPKVILRSPGEVFGTAVSPDGRYFASGTQNPNVLRIYDTASRTQLVNLNLPHTPSYLVFTPDGSHLVVGPYQPLVLETTTGRVLWQSAPNEKALGVSPDGRLAVLSTGVVNLRIFDLSLQREITVLRTAERTESASFSPDNRYVATWAYGYSQKHVAVFDSDDGREVFRAEHGETVNVAAFSPDNRYLASGSEHKTLVHNVRDWKLVSQPLQGTWFHLGFSGNGEILASDASGGKVGVFRVSDARDVARFEFGSISKLGVSSDGQLLIVAHEGVARVLNISTKQEVARLTFDKKVHSIDSSRDGHLIAFGSEVGALLSEVASQAREELPCMAAEISADGRRLLCVSLGISLVYDTTKPLTREEAVDLAQKAEKDTFVIKLSEDGRLGLANSYGSLAVYDLSVQRKLWQISGNADHVRTAFSADGRYLGLSFSDRTTRIVESLTGKETARFNFPAEVVTLRLSHNGNFLAVAGKDKVVRIVGNGGEKPRMEIPHDGLVHAIAFSPGSRQLATGSDTGTIRVFETSSGRMVTHLPYGLPLMGLQYSHDGRYLLALGVRPESETIAVSIFDVQSKAQLWSNPTRALAIGAAAGFSADEREVIIYAPFQLQRMFWRAADLISDACSRLERNLSPMEWRQYLGDEDYRKTCKVNPVPSARLERQSFGTGSSGQAAR